MYCSQCNCEFPDWIKDCPDCNRPLNFTPAVFESTTNNKLSYDFLMDLLRSNGGEIETELITTETGEKKKWNFPYFGYGFAWTKKLENIEKNITVELATSKVGMLKKSLFPFAGYGFAWAKEMTGFINGNKFTLSATKVEMQKKLAFPYFGFGYAWTMEMEGKCGNKINLKYINTEVEKKRKWEFPYKGYGFAWNKKGILSIKLESN